MPLINIPTENNIHLALWQIEEEEAYFLEASDFIDKKQLELYRHPITRLQWLASRYLLHKMIGPEAYHKMTKNERGKPVCENLNISISHSDKMVAVAVSEKKIGIDIQKFTDKIPNVSAKFIPEQELNSMKNADDFFYKCHIHWGIKEALFKADENGALDYRKHLFLNWNEKYSPEGANFEASIRKFESPVIYHAFYKCLFNDYLLCAVTNSGNGILY